MVSLYNSVDDLFDGLSDKHREEVEVLIKQYKEEDQLKESWFESFIKWNAAEGRDQERLAENLKSFSTAILTRLNKNDDMVKSGEVSSFGSLSMYGTVIYNTKDIELLFKMLGIF